MEIGATYNVGDINLNTYLSNSENPEPTKRFHMDRNVSNIRTIFHTDRHSQYLEEHCFK
jgi:hypothetical protein